ncbi:hypothetical protein KAW80_04110 [Candidatus Babeliales bacterium]|nr:hypothetical protein [Candidatus Babeliales bacterium]
MRKDIYFFASTFFLSVYAMHGVLFAMESLYTIPVLGDFLGVKKILKLPGEVTGISKTLERASKTMFMVQVFIAVVSILLIGWIAVKIIMYFKNNKKK